MYRGRTVGAVVPAYNEAGHVGDVIETVPGYVDRVYVVDDASTDGTWAEIRAAADRLNEAAVADGGTDAGDRVVPIRHETNRGVGGALKTGYSRARDDGMAVTVVLAGDGQMDPDLLERVVDPIVDGTADYVKGNRLLDPEHRAGMPRFRLVGNLLLTLLTRMASGYWRIGDPQNGYTAISGRALDAVNIESLYEFYGYCNELLVRLNVNDMRVADVPMPAVYGDEESHIRYRSYVPRVSAMLLRNFLWRLSTERRPSAFLYGLGAAGVGRAVLGALRRRTRAALAWAVLGALSLLLAVGADRAANREMDAGAVDPDGDRPERAER